MAWERRRRAWVFLESLPNFTRAGRARGHERKLEDGLTMGERLTFMRHVDAANEAGESWLGRQRLAAAAGCVNVDSVTAKGKLGIPKAISVFTTTM